MSGMEANYLEQGKTIVRKVMCLETGAVTRGYALVYDPTSTNTAAVTTEDLARGKYVVSPTATKDLYFAGVLLNTKTAAQGANLVEIAEPGSDCSIYVGEAVTAGDIVYFNVADGAFWLGGMGFGRGAAIVHTTLTGAGYAHATLLDGEYNGGVDRLAPTAGGAITCSLHGVTLLDGDDTGVTGNLTNTLANGTVIGQEKAFKVTTTVNGGNDFVLTVTTGVQLNGSTALASITFNSANEASILRWTGVHWKLIANSGATLA